MLWAGWLCEEDGSTEIRPTHHQHPIEDHSATLDATMSSDKCDMSVDNDEWESLCESMDCGIELEDSYKLEGAKRAQRNNSALTSTKAPPNSLKVNFKSVPLNP